MWAKSSSQGPECVDSATPLITHSLQPIITDSSEGGQLNNKMRGVLCSSAYWADVEEQSNKNSQIFAWTAWIPDILKCVRCERCVCQRQGVGVNEPKIMKAFPPFFQRQQSQIQLPCQTSAKTAEPTLNWLHSAPDTFALESTKKTRQKAATPPWQIPSIS